MFVPGESYYPNGVVAIAVCRSEPAATEGEMVPEAEQETQKVPVLPIERGQKYSGLPPASGQCPLENKALNICRNERWVH